MRLNRLSLAAFLIFATAGSIVAADLQVSRAELAVPFGSISGKLAVVGNYLVFIDEDRPEASFAISRDEIQNLNVDGKTLTVETSRTVRDRSGERSRISLRLRDSSDLSSLTNWRQEAPSQPAASHAERTERAAPMVFQARHNHRIGSCRGRLIVTEDKIAYDSVDQISDSRQWQYTDIKELKHDNPYELKIVPFNGNEYNLDLQGSGMDSSQFSTLVNRVTAARVSGQ